VSDSRHTCSPVEEQPQASCATGIDDVSANPPSMHKIIDVGNFAGRSLSEHDRRTFLLNSWTPSPYDFRVVHTCFQKRLFKVRWLEEFKWLACSEIHEGSLCKWCVACVYIMMFSAKGLGILVISAHKNWKKAKEDKLCADNFDVFIKLCKNQGNVDVRNMLSNSRKRS